MGAMGGLRAGGFAGAARAWLAATVTLGLAAPASAFEFFDGRLQIHGFFEEQIRLISDDFDVAQDFDLAQWYHVLNVEAEYDFAPDGWGPFDVLSGFIRLEARYDCVWEAACGMFPSADEWGNNVRTLPDSRTSGRSGSLGGAAFVGGLNSGPFNPRGGGKRYTTVRSVPATDGRVTVGGQVLEDPIIAFQSDRDRNRPARIDQLPVLSGLFVIRGPNAIFERGGDDPAFFYFSGQSNCRFGVRHVPGGENGIGSQIIGPVNPSCEVDSIGALRSRPNPFRPEDISPITGFGGSAELPARVAAEVAQGEGNSGRFSSQGVFYPSAGFQRWARKKGFDDPGLNFSQGDLSWNRGDSQGWEKELKEAYLDMEFLDSRLWVRAGRQSIVWGKTELFRTTDQFNPQDLALASLPSLEESRVALWSMRAVWSFYDVGPAEDVRLEVAANFDQFKPSDIGRCGEPFTALVACNKTTALWAHGLTGFALAGEDRPDNTFEDFQEGVEFGARVEWRMGRFSFQVSDFYGYEDLPYVHTIMSFERRVDPETGRPIRAFSRGSCVTGNEPACLPIESNINPDGSAAGSIVIPENRGEVLENYGSNIQLFTMICATSIGFSSLDLTACGQSVFNSLINPFIQTPPPVDRSQAKALPTLASTLANGAAGNPVAAGIGGALVGLPSVPLVPLNVDPQDSLPSINDPGGPVRGPHSFFAAGGATANQRLTDEQEALLGCGPFWGTDCEGDGIDLLNADAGVLMQSWVGFEGNYAAAFSRNGVVYDWSISNGEPQPGTLDFVAAGSSVPAGRLVNGRLVQLPGARYRYLADGVTPNPDWRVDQDGSIDGLVIPAAFGASAGQQFASEMAALSFNLEMILVAFSSRAAGATTSENNEFDNGNAFVAFDPDDPTTADFRGKCSFSQPQYCSSVIAFWDITGVGRNTVRAGGSSSFGRRDFTWHSGGEGVLRYNRRNVLGFSFDFAEDYTKSNWGAEFTWIEGQKFTDNDEFDGITDSDTLNLTVSVDRPTFINFLNQNRTIFFNAQFFFQYITNYNSGFPGNGPYNILGTLTAQTGYFQDRLLPGVTFVYDRRSNSGAALPSVSYRFTENFSATVGMNFFFGRFQSVDMPIQGLGTNGDETGRMAYQESVENGLAVVRERDEFFLRLRYTF